MKKSHVSLLLIAAFALGIFINKTYEIRQAHAATNRTLRAEMRKLRRVFKVEMRKTRRCIAGVATYIDYKGKNKYGLRLLFIDGNCDSSIKMLKGGQGPRTVTPP